MTSTTDELVAGPTSSILQNGIVDWVRWRGWLTYLAMSGIVAWHTLAIIVAPAPQGSLLVQSIRQVMQPYLSLFRLDTTWNFFAPSVGKHTQFRYVIENNAGRELTFVPTDEAAKSLSSYVWWREFKYLYEGIMESPETRAEGVVARLCQKHADLVPVSIALLEVQELDFWPADQLAGKHPLDPDFVTTDTLARIPCQNGSAILPPHHTTIRPIRRRP
jgi:hypothetical protein